MNVPADTSTKSPCIDICKLNEQDVCIGCGRNMDEICDWSTADETTRVTIAERATERLAAMGSLKTQSS